MLLNYRCADILLLLMRTIDQLGLALFAYLQQTHKLGLKLQHL